MPKIELNFCLKFLNIRFNKSFNGSDDLILWKKYAKMAEFNIHNFEETIILPGIELFFVLAQPFLFLVLP